MMAKSLEDINTAETHCIRAVASGSMKLMFALKKFGLDYPSHGPLSNHYNRLRREIRKAKSATEKKNVAKQSVLLCRMYAMHEC